MGKRIVSIAEDRLVMVEANYPNASEAICVARPGEYRFPGSPEGYTVAIMALADDSRVFVKTDDEDWIELQAGGMIKILPENEFNIQINSGPGDVTFSVEPFPPIQPQIPASRPPGTLLQ